MGKSHNLISIDLCSDEDGYLYAKANINKPLVVHMGLVEDEVIAMVDSVLEDVRDMLELIEEV